MKRLTSDRTCSAWGRAQRLASRLTLRHEIVLFALSIALFLQVVNLWLGPAVNWDEWNYHYSSVRNLLFDKPWNDLAISQRQSWLNPVPSIPSYLVIEAFPPRLASVLFAFFPVVNGIAAFVLARRFLFPQPTLAALVLAAACAFVGLTSAIHLGIVGTALNETWASSIVVAGCGCLMAANCGADDPATGRWWLLAGLAFGSAVGLKLTNVPFCFGALAATLVALPGQLKVSSKMPLFAAAGVAAFALTGGWWYFAIWAQYGNPVFPLEDAVFRSGWIGPADVPPELNFQRNHWWQLFLDPALLAVGNHNSPLSTVAPIRDARHLVGFYGSLATLSIGVARWRLVSANGRKRAVVAFAAFYLVSHICWVWLFNIDRYVLPLELVSPLTIPAAFLVAGWPARRIAVVTPFILGVVLVSTMPVKSARGEFGGDWFGFAPAAGIAAPNTLYVMTGWDALGWLTLYDHELGPRADFVRVAGNLTIDPARPLGQRIAARIGAHSGPMRSLTGELDLGEIDADLQPFGLVTVPGTCLTIANKLIPVTSCALRRRPIGTP